MEHRIVDIIDGTDECCIMLYGDIGDWGSIQPEDIVKKLMTAESEGRRIDVRINSVGGEVYAALAIFNALRASPGGHHNLHRLLGSQRCLCDCRLRTSSEDRLERPSDDPFGSGIC